MKKAQRCVQEFHEAFNATVAKNPTLPSVADQRLRLKLIEEEMKELDHAFLWGDLVGVADGIGDLLYVVLGTAVTCGIDIEPVFEEIHRSNMTKVGGHKDPETGKWIKPATYDPAKLIPILGRQAPIEPVTE